MCSRRYPITIQVLRTSIRNTTVLFPSKEKDLEEITLRLRRDGLSPESSLEERERHLWRLLQRSESSYTSATEDLQTLRTQQASEMREVSQHMAGGADALKNS